MPRITFNLNGQAVDVPYEPGMHFLEVLREECGVVSVKDGCSPEGTCGCCLVMVDGHPALSCLRKPEQMEGRQVVTVEGLPDDTRRILSEAFVLEGAVQCGFCIPGILVRAASLMEQGRAEDRGAVAKALDGHLCRCTGYGRIIDAIQTAGDASRHGGWLPSTEPRRHSYFGEDLGLRRNPAFAPGNERRTATATATMTGSADRSRATEDWSRRWAKSPLSTTCAFPACCTGRW